jgi:hypothetical protein
MSRKPTLTGIIADIPSAITYTNHYYFASDEGKYYLSDGVSWREYTFDFDDLSPETDAYISCGLSRTGSIDPLNVNPDGAMRIPTGSVVNRSGTIASGAVSQKLADANPNRQYLFIQNISSTEMYVGVGFIPTVGTGLFLHKDGGTLVWDKFVPTNQINIICNSNGTAFAAIEG